MRPLIAIITCHAQKYRERADAQRATWAQHAAKCGFDLKFFLGRPPVPEYRPADDEIFLDVDDGYSGMPAKMKAMCAWAAANEYEYVFKTDDDCYVSMAALMSLLPRGKDYVGRFRGPSGGYPADYASGYGYWLSNLAMRLVANAPLSEDWAEDRWVANTLARAGIAGYTDDRNYVACYPPVSPRMVFSGGHRFAAVWCEYPPPLMREMYFHHCHQKFYPPFHGLTRVPLPNERPVEPLPKQSAIIVQTPRKDLSKVCVLVKTFLRDGYLFDCVRAIEATLPEVKIVIMDDGMTSYAKNKLYDDLRAKGHVCEYLPYDSGFGEKSNAAIKHYDREYVLIASDDFDFSDPYVRPGIERLVTVMDNVPLMVASGRVDNNPYESLLERNGDTVREIPLKMGDWDECQNINYKLCDLTVNYSLIRTRVLGSGPRQVKWDGGEVKIGGGEHGAFFLDLKEHGHKVAFVPGVNINTMRYDPKKQDAIYDRMRGRARQPGRVCLRRRGLKRWILADGTVELV